MAPRGGRSGRDALGSDVAAGGGGAAHGGRRVALPAGLGRVARGGEAI